MQTFFAQFETFKMKEEEDIATYFLKVYEIVNSIKGLGATNEENSIVQKVMRNLPSRFNSKVSVSRIQL